MNVIKPYRYIPKEEIESQAADVIRRMQADRNRPLKWPLDATRVADFLDIGVVWESIPPDDEGSLAAMILPTKREIVINKDIPGLHGGFGESTLAHEIGHWELHIDQKAVGRFVERIDQGIEVNVQPLLCRSVSGQLKKIEWQAQYFASCLLMPRHIMEKTQKGRDLTRWDHLKAMAHELGVTPANLKHRLKDLGWIKIPDGSGPIYLGDAAPNRKTGAFE